MGAPFEPKEGDLRGQPERLGCGRRLWLHRSGHLGHAERPTDFSLVKHEDMDMKRELRNLVWNGERKTNL